jgi:hypothetical protein
VIEIPLMRTESKSSRCLRKSAPKHLINRLTLVA